MTFEPVSYTHLHDHCILCKKDFPLFDCRYDGFTENARPGIDGCTSEMAYQICIRDSYCRNQIPRLDIDVLARLCAVLNSEIGDLLEFVPP